MAEATAGWTETPDMLFVFCSAAQDPGVVAAALARRFPGVPMAGCTTAGEHQSGHHHRGSLVVSGLCDSGVDWVVAASEGLAEFDEERARQLVGGLFDAHHVDIDELDPSRFVALLFVDGLSLSEERVSANLAAALEGIPLAGGSAGDDLAFSKTMVICDGTAASDRAVVVLAQGRTTRFSIVKHQHFTATAKALAVTKADADRRTVIEIDGYPAAEAYARALGKSVDELDGATTSTNPVAFSCNGELYVRSIQAINDDGSMGFYCAIEEGMVLEIASHRDMKTELESDIATVRGDRGEADFMLGFNCILRALEAVETNAMPALCETIGAAAKSSIGFDTYGEQLNGLHINQTLVAVALHAS